MPFDGRVPLELTPAESAANLLANIARRVEAGQWTTGTLTDAHGRHCLLGYLYDSPDSPDDPELRELAVTALHEALPRRARRGVGPLPRWTALQAYNDYAWYPVVPRWRARGVVNLLRRAEARLRGTQVRVVHRGDRGPWRELRGPWSEEPDRVEWVDELTGLTCLARRNLHLGHWCGYVGVPAGHPLHGIPYYPEDQGDLEDHVRSLEVHGGLTYAAACDGDPAEGVCHVAEEGDHTWWFGFDCGHCLDVCPLTEHYRATDPTWPQASEPDEVQWRPKYRDLAYVQEQCRRLAAQLGGWDETASTSTPGASTGAPPASPGSPG